MNHAKFRTKLSVTMSILSSKPGSFRTGCDGCMFAGVNEVACVYVK